MASTEERVQQIVANVLGLEAQQVAMKSSFQEAWPTVDSLHAFLSFSKCPQTFCIAFSIPLPSQCLFPWDLFFFMSCSL